MILYRCRNRALPYGMAHTKKKWLWIRNAQLMYDGGTHVLEVAKRLKLSPVKVRQAIRQPRIGPAKCAGCGLTIDGLAATELDDWPMCQECLAMWPEDLRKLIRSLRRMRGWTLARLAEHTGVKEATLGAWERGALKPGWPELARLLRATGSRLHVSP